MADYQVLVDLFQNGGLDVHEIGTAKLPCFVVNPSVLLVGGGTVEVYQYPYSASRSNVLAKITPNYLSHEGLSADIIDDFSYLHIYDGDTLLVRYLGTNPVVEELLESALGAEFSGGNSVVRC